MSVPPTEVSIDLGRDAALTPHAIETLKDRYLFGDETSPQEGFARAAAAFADDSDHANRIYDYVSRGWFMFATPLLSNGGTTRGLPISCYLNYMDDSRDGIFDHYKETGWLSSLGGGVGGYIGDIRSKGEVTSKKSRTSGGIPFVTVIDRLMLAFSQGDTRRGSYAGYLDISHPEIEEWMAIRKPSGGDANRKALNLHHAVVIPDDFMERVLADQPWDLVDPHSGNVRKTVSARGLFRELVETRHQTGEPFILFGDTANRALPAALKAKGLKINHSNLCTEIMLPTSKDRTAVCCLSSVNLAKFDEWKGDTQFIEDLMRMLDNCLTQFIEEAPPQLWRAVASAKAERSVGLGAMGLHTFFQDRNLPWGSDLARAYNVMLFEHLKLMTDAASRKLAIERGEPDDMIGTGERFAHKMAVAPNASSSIFLQISPSAEQWSVNAYNHKTLTGSAMVRNPSLVALLTSKGLNTEAIWQSILAEGGSVQHLTDELSDMERMVYQTSFETDQRLTVEMANDRAPLIDQGQSVNLFFPAEVEADYLLETHVNAWLGGTKSLYYVRSQTAKRAENVNTAVERIHLVMPEAQECVACEG
jgi:ribonucleoside-diphosphate reductase alpha chain